MVFWSVLFDCCPFAGGDVTCMAGNTFAAQENLHSVLGGSNFYFATSVVKGNAIPAFIEFDVVVGDVDLGFLNAHEFVVLGRQRFQCWFIDFFETRET